MSEITKEFWNYLSKYYTNYPIINHDGNYEMNYIFNILLECKNIKQLACFGVADGTRDPLEILNFLKEIDKLEVNSIILDDISEKLLELCRVTLKDYSDIKAQYVAKPIHVVENIERTKNAIYFMGIYDADYIEESLQIYVNNKGEMGEFYDIGWIYEEDMQFKRKGSIKFKIDDYMQHLDRIQNFRENKNFVAYSIITEKGFVTHHYDINNFGNVCTKIFNGNVEINSVGNRHIICKISTDENDLTDLTIITTLNNVVGNIPHDLQIASLQNLNNLFF